MLISEQELDDKLQTTFGLDAFRPGQLPVLQRLLAGKSAAAIFPTGGGKSLCYQLPATVFEGLTLVVSPLLALMREQVDFLNSKGIPAGRLDSTLSADESRQLTEGVRAQRLRLLYVAPERFFNERFRAFIKEIPISLFAIDEAHCISQWGHNFRPDYLKLAKLAQELEVERVLALTATATPQVLDDICAQFSIPKEDAVQTPFYRPNLHLRFSLCEEKTRDRTLLEKLKDAPEQPTLVYVTLQKTAEVVADLLQANDLNAKAYHAGMPADERESIQDWFMQSDSGIVVATIAFGMGIDKPNIRAVYHYNASKSIENFAQEIGRAGRDGNDSVCETLLVPEDRIVLDNFAYGDTPSETALRRFVEFLVGQPKSFFVSYYSLAYETDIRDSVVRTLLTNLELQEWLDATSPRYEAYQFKPRKSSMDILKHFEGERRVFASSVLAMSVKKKIWFEVNLAQAASRLECERSRIVKMLDYFAEKGWIELKASGLVHGYRKLREIQDIEGLTQELLDVVMERQIGELSRLNELFDLMTADACQAAQLSAHFGQDVDVQCGNCSYCQKSGFDTIPQSRTPRVGDSALMGLGELRKQKPLELGEALQQARFLCGLSSPKSIRARLTREPLYGCCASVPFDYVLETVMEH
ncbi:MAG: RecQ family ATP-dependent DNA helicase [Planctomycetota bacterium]